MLDWVTEKTEQVIELTECVSLEVERALRVKTDSIVYRTNSSRLTET